MYSFFSLYNFLHINYLKNIHKIYTSARKVDSNPISVSKKTSAFSAGNQSSSETSLKSALIFCSFFCLAIFSRADVICVSIVLDGSVPIACGA